MIIFHKKGSFVHAFLSLVKFMPSTDDLEQTTWLEFSTRGWMLNMTHTEAIAEVRSY